jgi:hypothetical protein
MPVVCWFYRSFANSFTVCLIVAFVFQALRAVSCPFFLGQGRQAGRLTADNEKNNRCLTPADPPATPGR